MLVRCGREDRGRGQQRERERGCFANKGKKKGKNGRRLNLHGRQEFSLESCWSNSRE